MTAEVELDGGAVAADDLEAMIGSVVGAGSGSLTITIGGDVTAGVAPLW